MAATFATEPDGKCDVAALGRGTSAAVTTLAGGCGRGLGAGAVLGGDGADAGRPRSSRPPPCPGNGRADRAAISRGLADAVGSVSSPGQDFSIPSRQLRSASLAGPPLPAAS